VSLNSEDFIYKVSGIAEHLLKGIFSQPSPMGYHLSKLAGHEGNRHGDLSSIKY